VRRVSAGSKGVRRVSAGSKGVRRVSAGSKGVRRVSAGSKGGTVGQVSSTGHLTYPPQAFQVISTNNLI